MFKVLVIGAGRVGSVIARDLSGDGEIAVTLADSRKERIDALTEKMGVTGMVADLSAPSAVRAAVSEYDLVVGALPGALGRRAMEGVVAAGKMSVDISFMAEDPRVLDQRAKETGALVFYDFGVAPGMSNLIAAVGADALSPARRIRIYVGGLPMVRRLPFEYSAPFSPADVIEEYVRPARVVRGGEVVTRPALSGLEHIDLPGVGTLEAFLSDGLRSLVDTVDCPDMAELTLRYPGHRDRIKLLADAGFLSAEPVSVNGVAIAPVDVSLAVLDAAWQPDTDSEEFTAMQIAVTGGPAGDRTRTWYLLDRTDPVRGETSMARTTGFPVAILAREMLRGRVPFGPGVYPPEALASAGALVSTLFEALAARGVTYAERDVDSFGGE